MLTEENVKAHSKQTPKTPRKKLNRDRSLYKQKTPTTPISSQWDTSEAASEGTHLSSEDESHSEVASQRSFNSQNYHN